jgi:DNA-binding MarR family transcriptional regulator
MSDQPECPVDKTIARECYAVRLRMINRAVTAIYDDLLRPHGLTINQLNILVAISQLIAPTQADVGRALQMDKSTVSRNADRLIGKGWLIAYREEDKRKHRLEVTEEGHAVIEKAFPAWQAAQEKTQSLLGEESMSGIRQWVQSVHLEGR